MKRWRLYTTLAVLGAAVAGICLIPFPSHVYAPLDVQARKAATVYVDVDGFLNQLHVRPGDQVTARQPLAQLSSIDIELKIASLQGERDVYTAQLNGLKRASIDDPHASDEISRVKKALESVETQLAQQEDDQRKLTLTAPQDGTVLPPPRVEDQSSGGAQLPQWSGSPFDRENLGAALRMGTKFCQIGDPNRLEARLVIDQGDVEFVTDGQRVEIMLDQSAEFVYVSTIERVSTKDLKVTPTNLSGLHGGPLPSQMTPAGVAEPLTPVFEALVPLPEKDPHSLLRVGLIGRAKIATQPRTLFERVYRYIKQTFNFEL